MRTWNALGPAGQGDIIVYTLRLHRRLQSTGYSLQTTGYRLQRGLADLSLIHEICRKLIVLDTLLRTSTLPQN